MRQLTVVLSALVLLAGCASDPIEERWKRRAEFRSCGEVSLDPLESLETDGQKEVACMRRAREMRKGAELKVTFRTVEGDPVREYYRVTPQGKLEIYTDATDDHFSGKDWDFVECDAPTPLAKLEC
jgi:hypothetical protein